MFKKIISRKQKRVTLVHLLIKYIGIAVIISLLFAAGYKRYIENDVAEQARESVARNSADTIREINDLQGSSNIINDIDSYLSMFSNFSVDLNDEFGYEYIYDRSQGSGAAAVLIDENNNIVASNKLTLCIMLNLYGEKNTVIRYQCKNTPDSIPEVKQLYKDYIEIYNAADKSADSVEIYLDSIYVNRNDRTFIPGKGSLKYFKGRYSERGEVLHLYSNEPAKELDINIQFNDDNYELIDFSDDGITKSGFWFFGTPEEQIEEMISDPFSEFRSRSHSSGGIRYGPKPLAYMNTPLYIDGKEYTLSVIFKANTEAPEALAFYFKRVLGFTAVMLTAAVLFCIVQNIKNKARYELEDHQKALTNNLAHDIKTPLTAISGYAENLQKAIEAQDTEKASGYISAILENVDYTDSIVCRTLELNQISDIRKINKTDINMRKLAENIINKYALMTEEKSITVNISGEMSLQADEASICSAVENLLTNALKYTIPSGGIDIILNKRSFIVTNDIFQKIDTKNLTMPFVKGDTARSKKLGSGLGLSIVKNAANLNRLRLSISSTDNKFTAVLSK